MVKNTSKSHDAFFRKMMSNVETVRDFLCAHLSAMLCDLCDFDSLRLEPGASVEPGRRRVFCDLLYSVQTRHGKQVYFYFLIEHQSTADPLMAFRLMEYCIRLLRARLGRRKGKHVKLPLIIPILFYHGEVVPYPYSTDWLEVFEDPKLAREVYCHPFPLVDIGSVPDDRILKHKRAALPELMMKHIRHEDTLELADRVAPLLRKQPLWEGQLEAVTYYLLEAGNADDPDELVERMARRLPGHEEEVMNAAEQLRQRGWREGWQKGRLEGSQEGWQKGRLEGLQEGRLALAGRLLLRGRPVEEIVEDTGLSMEEIRRLRSKKRTLH